MHVVDLLEGYIAAHDLGAGTIVWFNCAISRWSRYLERLPASADFVDHAFNAWLTHELKTGQLSRQTLSSYRRAMLMLWRWAWKEGKLDAAPRNPKTIKAPLPVPVGMSAADVDRLLSVAATLRGTFRGSKVSKAAFYRALILLVWDAGIRLGDALRLTWTDLERGAIVQKKTGWPKYFRVSVSTRKAVEAVRISDNRVLGGAVSRRHVVTGMKRLRELAALSVGGTKAIRKGAASIIERKKKGAASQYLGHRTAGLAERHYLDPSIVNHKPPMPPAIRGVGRRSR